jgi:quercetin dioxygenase-like cupin family protein
MPPIRRPLLSVTLDGRPRVEGVQITEIELPANEPTGLHVHPVPVVGYVLAGQIRFEIEGQTPRTLTTGSAFYEPAGAHIRQFDNASPIESARFVAVYLRGAGEQELIRMLEE